MLNLIKKKKKFCVFDIGTDKVVCILFRVENNKPIILGMDHQKSVGFMNGTLIDDNKLSENIHRAFKTSLPKGSNISNFIFFSNITDKSLITRKSYIEVDTGKLSITKKDVRKIFKKSVSESKLKGKYLIHSEPTHFRVNDKISENPIGIESKKLGISSFNLMVDNKLQDRLQKCFKEKKIEITSFFETGVASAIGNLSELEKKEGVASIDIGSTSTKVTVFKDNKIAYSNIIRLGGENVTNDISKGLSISIESAEHTKIVNGTLTLPFNEKIEINTNKNINKEISRNFLYGIIKPRYEEILEIIRDDLFDDLYARVSIKSVVLSGGASKIFGISDLSESIFNRKIRIGGVNDKSSYFFNKPEFSTILGLIKLAKDNKKYEYSNVLKKGNIITAFDKLENWIEESYA
tara:strand:- start:250 stop:1470 length:1221 start_codon:yes stop_codon:yes gene_type:complete